MTVTFDWLEDDDGDNQESGGLDAYIDVDGSGVSFSGDQISSSNFDGGIPKAQPENTQVRYVVPGNYVFWNIATNTPLTPSIGDDADGEDEDSESEYESNLYLVLDVEYDDNLDPDGTSTTATRYLYLQDEDESVKVSATGGTTVTIIGNSSPAEWDAGTNGWILTSDGNAIFSNILARGAIYASSGEISGNLDVSGNLSFTGSLIGNEPNGTTVGVKIYGNNQQISSSNFLGVINAIGTSNQTAFDANDIQTFAFNTTNPSTLRIQRLGGGLIVGSDTSDSDTIINGDLEVTKNLTVSGSFSPTSISTGALTATGTVNFSTAGIITLGANDVNVLVSNPSSTGRALNVGGNANIEGELSVNTLTGFSSAAIAVNDTLNVNASLFADYVGAPRFVASTSTDASHFTLINSTSNYTSDAISLKINDSTGYNFMQFYNTGTSYTDLKMRFQANGDLRIDGAVTTGGADYAEYFEWEDGNPNNEDRVGISVSLVNNKIKECLPGEIPIGVISYTGTVVGDSAWNAWNKKYLKDDFGRLIVEYYNVIKWYNTDGEVVSYIENEIPNDVIIPEEHEVIKKYKATLNPEFDENENYVPREDRPEWSPVGLLGKIRIKKGQITSPTWIKLRDISENVEEWLVK